MKTYICRVTSGDYDTIQAGSKTFLTMSPDSTAAVGDVLLIVDYQNESRGPLPRTITSVERPCSDVRVVSLGGTGTPAVSDTDRYRQALENLSKVDQSGAMRYGSAGASIVANMVNEYARKVLDGGEP